MSEHEGMMTRREVLKGISEEPEILRSAGFTEPYITGVTVALCLAIGAKSAMSARHELALLMDAEREEER